MSPDLSIVTCPHCGKKNRVSKSATGWPRCRHCREGLPWVVEVDDSSFSSATETSLLTLIDLWAPWCGPCRLVAPVLERLATIYAGQLKVVKVNVDESPRLASKYQAMSIPMLVFERRGRVLETVVGAQPEQVLRQHVDQLLATHEGS